MGDELTVESLAAIARHAAIVEAEAWSAMLRFADLSAAESELAPSPMAALIERSRIPLEIGEAVGLSEGQVQGRLAVARTIRDRAPLVWIAFQTGWVDASRIREIASTVDKLKKTSSVDLLDTKVVEYASTHTVGELRRWLRRFVERTEPDETVERADDERKRRHVRIDHVDDGMSWLTAYLPSLDAAAIERRLHHESRALPSDGRTLEQKKADLLTGWATCNEAGEAARHADVAVVIDADVLAGARQGFAESADGSWSVPAHWTGSLIRSGSAFWFRMVVDPVTRDVLSIDHAGRFAPDLLRKAIGFRDGVCSSPGCLVPAWACDLDHQIPWPQGPTNGDNLAPRSRRHHAQKGHGLDPPRRISPADAARLDPIIEYVPT